MKIFLLIILYIFQSSIIFPQKVSTITFENWKDNSWQNSMRQTNVFDSSGYLITTLTELWDTSLKHYYKWMRISYINNEDSAVRESITQTFNVMDSSWINFQRLTYESAPHAPAPAKG